MQLIQLFIRVLGVQPTVIDSRPTDTQRILLRQNGSVFEMRTEGQYGIRELDIMFGVEIPEGAGVPNIGFIVDLHTDWRVGPAGGYGVQVGSKTYLVINFVMNPGLSATTSALSYKDSWTKLCSLPTGSAAQTNGPTFVSKIHKSKGLKIRGSTTLFTEWEDLTYGLTDDYYVWDDVRKMWIRVDSYVDTYNANKLNLTMVLPLFQLKLGVDKSLHIC